MAILKEQAIKSYQSDGALLIPGLFTEWVETLQAGVEENISNPGEYCRIYPAVNDSGQFFGDYCNWDRIPQYRQFLFESSVGQAAAELMASKETRVFHEHVLVKEPGSQNVTPWHHDQPYYCVDGKQVVSFWVPLDDIVKENCPEFIRGSHNWGRWFLPRKFSGADYDHSGSHLETIPDFDAERDKHEFLSWDLKAGDAIAFHYLTVHGAPANSSRQTRRRAFSARVMGDDATYVIRSGEMSPPFPGLDEQLKQGGAMDCELFPVIWPAA